MTPTPEQNAKRIAELRKDYAPIVPPPCPVCGGPRDSICAAGMGRVTYCCSSEDAEPMGKGDRFDECMEHFSKSRYETVSRDSRVIELCDAYEQVRLAADGMAKALEPFAQHWQMGDHYVRFAPHLIGNARDALAAYRAAGEGQPSNPSNSLTDSRDSQG